MISLFLMALPIIGKGEKENYSDANRLEGSSSPYLIQHQDNPVHWLPWGEEAFEEARRLDRPVLLSIGYSTCHWCHVMEHENFEDEEAAELMNNLLINIKVDREELPAVDAYYMEAAALMGAGTGWPLNIFLDSQERPFFAGTYFPKEVWKKLILQVDDLWRTRKPQIEGTGSALTDAMKRGAERIAGEAVNRSGGGITEAETKKLFSAYLSALVEQFNPEYPGFSPGSNTLRSPQFPPSGVLSFLLELKHPAGLTMAEQILETMQDSGIHDRVGGGFHRYTVDRAWRIPHFEKMLYDNVQLMGLYARGGVIFDREDFMQTAADIGDYLLRDMRLTDGRGRILGYATAEDADDTGGEGAFYAWSPGGIRSILPADEAEILIKAWDLRENTDGNLGASGHEEPVAEWIPYPLGSRVGQTEKVPDIRIIRNKLLKVRAKRPRPSRDDKVLTGLNGLALEGFSLLARSSGEVRFLRAVEELAENLVRTYRDRGVTRVGDAPPYISDYAFLILGLTAAYPLLEDPGLIEAARDVARDAVKALAAPGGSFYSTSEDSLGLPVRKIDPFDTQIPSGQSALALGFARLYTITGDEEMRDPAVGVVTSQKGTVQSYPTTFSTLFRASLLLSRRWHIVLAGNSDVEGYEELKEELIRRVGGDYSIITAQGEGNESWPLLKERRDLSSPQVLICNDTACLLPAYTVAEMNQRLEQAGIL